ncbi:MAG: GNAT family N-acetyltransferase [Gaiellales bacterium]|jgi:RimJ/RimL family protein N-acetyltransferase
MTEMPALTTERLSVRPLTSEDFPAYRALEPDIPDDRQRATLAWRVASYRELGALLQPPYGERAIALGAGGALVGLCGLVPSFGPFGLLESWPRDHDEERARRFLPAVGMYWMLDPAHRGNGYATEAAAALIAYGFGEMRLQRIVATTEHANTASQAVMRRLGMRLDRNPEPEPPWFQVVGILDSSPRL